jgi:autotransporter-associated beta strand protein
MGTDQSGSSALITIAAASSNLTINGSYTASTAVTWDVGAGRTLTLNGPLNNWYASAALIKKGAGTAVLNGASTYSGTTTVTEGTLKLQGGAFSTAARAYSIASNAVLNLEGDTAAAYGTTTLGGNGTLLMSGGTLANGAGFGFNINMELDVGALIEIQSGATLQNGGWQNIAWTANKANMQVDGTFDIWDGSPARIDALTGSGTVNKYHGGNSPSYLTVGVNNGSGTFSGTIVNASGLIAFNKVGSGTQVLTGANSYGGVTTIEAGMLVASNSTALGAGGFRGDTMTFINDGATLALQGGISLDEHFHVWGSGVDGLGAVRSISGTNALTSSYNGGAGYSLRTNTTVGVDADTLSITGFYQEGGSFSLTKVGAGTLIMTAENGYTGGTLINEGTLIAGAGGVAKGAVILASGAILSTTSASSTGLAALYYNNSAIDQADIGSLPALLTHFGANTPAPTLVQTAPSMNFAGDGSGFPAPYNSGASNFESFYSGKINIAISGTYTFNTSSDDGSMLFIDGQVVVVNNVFQPVTTQTGSIALTAGMHDIVIAYNQGGGGYGMNAQMSGPDNTTMVDINTANASITPDLVVGSLAGEGSVSLTTGNLITGIDNSSTTFTGALSGIGSVTKFGTGTQTLSGTNTYSGATTISAGTLRIDGNSSGVNGTLTVESGAFLGGTGSYGGTITLKSGAALNCELNLTDSTLTCGQLSFSNLDFENCTFTVAPGAGSPPYRRFTLIETTSLGTTTFANAAGTIAGEPAKLSLSGNALILSVGRPGTVVSFF